jgi:hypothetical protein
LGNAKLTDYCGWLAAAIASEKLLVSESVNAEPAAIRFARQNPGCPSWLPPLAQYRLLGRSGIAMVPA